MEDEAKIYKELLNQIEDNQKKIDAINDEIHLLNQRLNGADPKTKLKIYEEHKKLTQTLNRLYEENEVIEYKAQGETKNY